MSHPLQNPNDLVPASLKEQLRKYQWRPDNLVDLHKLGVHYHDESFLPSWISPITYLSYARAGLTPPVSLPTYFGPNTEEHIKQWLNLNHHKLTHGGVQYLGNEANILPAEEFEKRKVRVCICRMSDYANIDGAFGHFLVNNFIQDFSDDVFIDFAFRPADKDYPRMLNDGIPLWFGNTTKRPLSDFDFVLISNSFPQERLNVPFLLAKSGLPLYRWQREDTNLPYGEKRPIIMTAGLGAFFAENIFADHPTKGVAQGGLADFSIIGEGESLDLRLFQHYANSVVDDGMTRQQFIDSIDNTILPGIYDPRRTLWEYHDKVHTQKNHLGEQLGEPQVYPQGGQIKRVSILDYETQTKHVIAGEGSTQWSDMEKANVEFLDNIKGMQNPVEYAEPFKRTIRIQPANETLVTPGVVPKTPGVKPRVVPAQAQNEEAPKE